MNESSSVFHTYFQVLHQCTGGSKPLLGYSQRHLSISTVCSRIDFGARIRLPACYLRLRLVTTLATPFSSLPVKISLSPTVIEYQPVTPFGQRCEFRGKNFVGLRHGETLLLLNKTPTLPTKNLIMFTYRRAPRRILFKYSSSRWASSRLSR